MLRRAGRSIYRANKVILGPADDKDTAFSNKTTIVLVWLASSDSGLTTRARRSHEEIIWIVVPFPTFPVNVSVSWNRFLHPWKFGMDKEVSGPAKCTQWCHWTSKPSWFAGILTLLSCRLVDRSGESWPFPQADTQPPQHHNSYLGPQWSGYKIRHVKWKLIRIRLALCHINLQICYTIGYFCVCV